MPRRKPDSDSSTGYRRPGMHPGAHALHAQPGKTIPREWQLRCSAYTSRLLGNLAAKTADRHHIDPGDLPPTTGVTRGAPNARSRGPVISVLSSARTA